MTQQPPWPTYTAFAQRPEKPFARKPHSIFWPTPQQHQPLREASIAPMYECDAPAEGRPDSLDGLVKDLSNKFTTLETVHGVAQSPPSSIVGLFDRSRRSTIREEEEKEAPEERMSILCTARFQSVYDDGMSVDGGEEGRICSMADLSTAKGQRDGDGSLHEEWRKSTQDYAYSAMSVGD